MMLSGFLPMGHIWCPIKTKHCWICHAHMESIYTHTHTHTHRRVNGASRWLSTPGSQVTRTHFPKQHFIFAFFLFGVVAIWTPVTYFHLAAESLQDCRHFKRAKPFTLLQWINQNIKTPLCYLFIYFCHKLCYILRSEREASSLQKEKRAQCLLSK